MTANVSSGYTGSAPTRGSGARVAVGLLGVLTAGLGIVLLFNPVATAKALALLVGLSFVVAGLLEIAVGWESAHRGLAVVLGGLLVVGGILAALWPGVTLFGLALITGLSLIVHGIGRVGVAVVDRDQFRGWGWLALLGAVNVLVGVLAVVWPRATVLVLCLVLGLQVLLLGLVLVVAAFWRPGAEEVPPMG